MTCYCVWLFGGSGANAPDNSFHLFLRVFLFRFYFFFLPRNQKEKVNKRINIIFVRNYYTCDYLNNLTTITIKPVRNNMSLRRFFAFSQNVRITRSRHISLIWRLLLVLYILCYIFISRRII